MFTASAITCPGLFISGCGVANEVCGVPGAVTVDVVVVVVTLLLLGIFLRISEGLSLWPRAAGIILVMVTQGGSGGVEGGNNEAVHVGST